MRLHPHEGISTAFRCPQEPQEGFPEEAAELIFDRIPLGHQGGWRGGPAWSGSRQLPPAADEG